MVSLRSMPLAQLFTSLDIFDFAKLKTNGSGLSGCSSRATAVLLVGSADSYIIVQLVSVGLLSIPPLLCVRWWSCSKSLFRTRRAACGKLKPESSPTFEAIPTAVQKAYSFLYQRPIVPFRHSLQLRLQVGKRLISCLLGCFSNNSIGMILQ